MVSGYGLTTGRKRGTQRQNQGMQDTKVFHEGASISVEKRYETQIKGTKFELKVRNSKSRCKIVKKIYENTKRSIVSQFRETTRNTFFRIFIFFSFAKRSKLDKTVTCFVKFRISRN